ncbi:MAG: metallophosphoesterase family protein [Rhodothermales bacterium]
MSLYGIGDIHGCVNTLDLLLEKIEPGADDHLVFIGDYVDRGPNTKAVIERLIRLQGECECTFLRGNHEEMMLDFLDFRESELWHINGGDATLASYLAGTGNYAIPEEHETFVRETVAYWNEPDFFFVHAGLKPHLTIEENLVHHSSEVFLWERSHLAAKELAWEKPVVCGHTPQREPIDRPLLICIDTGCVYTSYPGYGVLTAVRLPDREMIQVKFAD